MTPSHPSDPVARSSAPENGWTALIDDMVAGRWIDPESGRTVSVPYDSIVFRESLDGAEADLVRALDLGASFAVVADEATYDALGARVAERLKPLGRVETVILDHPHADMWTAAELAPRIAGVEGVVAVGSGTINDLCKYITGQDGRRYCVFGTAGSMNGYTSTTASMTLESGLKVSLPSHAPSGFFVDLGVSAAAPKHLAAAGFGDCLARSVAQVDWWMSHRLLGTLYLEAPYLIEEADEIELNKRAASLAAGDIAAIGYLYRVLTLCGLGVSFTGISNHGSMGEHQISHYIDCFARERHPGTLHGQQVGVASLTMARLQQRMFASERPPIIKPTRIDEAGMARRMGKEIAAQCFAELRKKAFDESGAAAFNEKLARLWPALRAELAAFIIPVDEMTRLLAAAGGPTTARDLGLPKGFYREATLHCREMRNRFSFLDIAADAGYLEDFATGED
jgi:glycerol-1-phosphate dehydrogenase [NAD(P)+]